MSAYSIPEDFFQVRMTVDSLHANVVQLFPAKEIEVALKNAVDKAMSKFDFEKEIEEEVCRLLRTEIRYAAQEQVRGIVRELINKATPGVIKKFMNDNGYD